MNLHKDTHRLWVEGVNDGSVVNQLVKRRLGIDLALKDLQIVDLDPKGGGFTYVEKQLRAALVGQKYKRLGAVVDRDGFPGVEDLWPRFQKVVQAAGIPAPQLPATGFVAEAPWGARVGLWFMPDNVQFGDLEEFIEQLLPSGTDRSWPEEATRTAKATHGVPFKPIHERKAVLHTWRAWRDPPGIPYGVAIGHGDVLDKSPAADAFVDWFKRLFIDP